jgi:hypothetical protein
VPAFLKLLAKRAKKQPARMPRPSTGRRPTATSRAYRLDFSGSRPDHSKRGAISATRGYILDAMPEAATGRIRRTQRRAFAVCACIGALACADRSHVTLSASIQDAQVEVEALTLGTRLGGTFDLDLQLGDKADGTTEVSLETFSLVRHSDATPLVAPLPVTPVGETLPISVGKGDRRSVSFSIGNDDLLSADALVQICAAEVAIIGAISDSLSGGRTTSLESGPVTPICP